MKRSYSQIAPVVSSSILSSEPSIDAKFLRPKVVAIENYHPIARVSVLAKCGPSFESYNDLGISHMMRRYVGNVTKTLTGFGIIRNCLQNGVELSVTMGREHISYNAVFNRDFSDVGLAILKEISFEPKFSPWEVEAVHDILHKDCANRDHTTIAVENIHKAVFRRGLGNSMYISDHRIDEVEPEDLAAFHEKTHLVAGTCIVGFGVDAHIIGPSFDQYELLGSAKTPTTPFHAGDVRTETGGDLAHVIVCGQRPGFNDPLHYAYAVAEAALGSGNRIKYGGGIANALTAAALKAGDGCAKAFNASYSTAGLFGYSVVADAAAAGKVVRSVHEAVKSTELSDKDVEIAKKKLKVAYQMSQESQMTVMDNFGHQMLFNDAFLTISDVKAKIDAVTSSEVNSVIQNILKGNVSIGAVGALDQVPYADEL